MRSPVFGSPGLFPVVETVVGPPGVVVVVEPLASGVVFPEVGAVVSEVGFSVVVVVVELDSSLLFWLVGSSGVVVEVVGSGVVVVELDSSLLF